MSQIINNIVCKKCNGVLPPHTLSEHLDLNNKIHECPHVCSDRCDRCKINECGALSMSHNGVDYHICEACMVGYDEINEKHNIKIDTWCASTPESIKLFELIWNEYEKMEFPADNPYHAAALFVPITAIDGIACNCSIVLKKWMLSFDVNLSCLYNLDENDDVENVILYRIFRDNEKSVNGVHPQTGRRDPDEILKFANVVLRDLKLLKLNVNGRLSTNNDYNKRSILMAEIFADIDNITLDCPEECCVCNDMTDTKTPCGHRLCYRCWSNVISKCDNDHRGDDYDDELPPVPCPICRADIRYCNRC